MANNIEMLQRVAKGLGELKEEVVFVGGSVAELYADDPATPDVRPTLDVDCVVELTTQTSMLLADRNIEEAISCALPLYSEEERVTYIAGILEQIRTDNLKA